MSSITITSYFSKDGVPSLGLTPSIRIWEVSTPNKLIIGSPDGINLNTDGTMSEIISSSGTQDGFYKFEFTQALGYSNIKQYLVKIDGGVTEQGYERFQITQISPTPTTDIVDAILNEPTSSHNIAGTVGEQLNLIVNKDLIINGVLDSTATSHNIAGTIGEKINEIVTQTSLVNAIYNEPFASHNTTGTMGLKLNLISSKDDIADAVVDNPLTGHTITGSVGEKLGQISTKDQIVDAVLDEPIIQHTQFGSVGQKINEIATNNEQLTLSLIDVQDLIRLILKYDTNRTKIDVVHHTLTVYDDDCSTPLRTFKLYDAFGQPNVADVVERRPLSSGTTDGKPVCN